MHSALVARRQTEVNLQQNEQVKRISSWAAIIFAPTLIGTVYGMNFGIMPELPASAQVNISSVTRSRYPPTRSGLRMDSSLARTGCAIDIPLASQLANSCAEVGGGGGDVQNSGGARGGAHRVGGGGTDADAEEVEGRQGVRCVRGCDLTRDEGGRGGLAGTVVLRGLPVEERGMQIHGHHCAPPRDSVTGAVGAAQPCRADQGARGPGP